MHHLLTCEQWHYPKFENAIEWNQVKLNTIHSCGMEPKNKSDVYNSLSEYSNSVWCGSAWFGFGVWYVA